MVLLTSPTPTFVRYQSGASGINVTGRQRSLLRASIATSSRLTSESLLTDNTTARREEVRGRGTANTQLKTKVVGASPSPDLLNTLKLILRK